MRERLRGLGEGGLLATVLFVAGLLSGCFPKTVIPFNPALAEQRVRAVGAEKSTDRDGLPATLQWKGSVTTRAGYEVQEFDLPSSGHNRQPGDIQTGVYFRFPTGERRERKGLVIILPIYGSSDYPGNTTLRHLIRGPGAGAVNVMILRGPNYLFDWDRLADSADEEELVQELDRSAATFEAVIEDIRRLIDWAESQPDIDPQRIGLVGFSIGSILITVIAGVDDRPQAFALVMGGGDIANSFVSCDGPAEDVVRDLLGRFGWSREELRLKVAESLAPIEPLAFARGVDPTEVLSIESGRDQCVPEPGREALWRAMGRPERVLIERRHRRSFLSMTLLDFYATTRRITNFMVRKLGLKSLP